MSCVWLTASFNYYMISFMLKYWPGSIYVNGLVSAVSETLAYMLSGVIFKCAGVRVSLIFSYALAFIGGLAIIVYEKRVAFFSEEPKQAADWIFPTLVIVAKFGIACAFNISFVANIEVFPLDFQLTALGFCSFLARFLSLFASEVAEIQYYTPMIFLTTMSALTMILVFFLKPQKV